MLCPYLGKVVGCGTVCLIKVKVEAIVAFPGHICTQNKRCLYITSHEDMKLRSFSYLMNKRSQADNLETQRQNKTDRTN